MILLLDNYDSFVHNLARYFRLLGCEVETVRNDEITVDSIERRIQESQLQAVVMSPGPCTPNQAGICLEVVRRFHRQVPMLGVCLGHQALVQGLGGTVACWDHPIHGKCDLVYHDQSGEFETIPTPFRAARYHSLIADHDTLPAELSVSAKLEDGTIMGIRHRDFPLVGYQFHPESILTEHGLDLIAGFLRLAQIPYRSVCHSPFSHKCEWPSGLAPLSQPKVSS